MKLFFLVNLTAYFVLWSKLVSLQLPSTFNKTQINVNQSLEYVDQICNKNDEVCKMSGTKTVCARRFVNSVAEYREFNNWCFVLLDGICNNSKNPFFIVAGETCADLKIIQELHNNSIPLRNVSESLKGNFDIIPIMQLNSSGVTRRYLQFDCFESFSNQSFDGHCCLHLDHCPNIYAPVCIQLNKEFIAGKGFRMFLFDNHCLADLYFCTFPNEFAPETEPAKAARSNTEEEEVEDDDDAVAVEIFELTWDKCSSTRFMELARDAKYFSTMGHYGWLTGADSFKFSHILNDAEKGVAHKQGMKEKTIPPMKIG